MQKIILLVVAALVLVLLFSPIAPSAQEQTEPQKITVKSKEVNNGVVILTVQEGKNSLGLQCNKEFGGCVALDAGDYLMVRLPKNRGMYDCANTEVFRKAPNAELGDKIGQYCLVQSK
jgi:hypothetical protein